MFSFSARRDQAVVPVFFSLSFVVVPPCFPPAIDLPFLTPLCRAEGSGVAPAVVHVLSHAPFTLLSSLADSRDDSGFHAALNGLCGSACTRRDARVVRELLLSEPRTTAGNSGDGVERHKDAGAGASGAGASGAGAVACDTAAATAPAAAVDSSGATESPAPAAERVITGRCGTRHLAKADCLYTPFYCEENMCVCVCVSVSVCVCARVCAPPPPCHPSSPHTGVVIACARS